MNEDKKRPAPNKKGKAPPKKGKKGLVVVIILFLIIGGLITVMALNLFDFREGVVMPYLRNMPLVGGFFPAAEEEEDDDLPLEQMTPQQLANIIREQEQKITELEEEMRTLLARARADALHIARLLPFREHWDEYLRVSAEFNAMIARGDPEAYLRFIEYIMPEFYEQLARDAMGLNMYRESVTTIVRTLGNMQESNAAEVLVDLRTTDLILLTHVLNEMGNALRGAILDEMEPTIASAMLRLISVPEPELPPLAPPLITPILPETIEEIEEEDEEEDEGENGEGDEGDNGEETDAD